MSLMPWPTIRIAVLRVRPTSARVLPAIAIVSLLLLANDVAALRSRSLIPGAHCDLRRADLHPSVWSL